MSVFSMNLGYQKMLSEKNIPENAFSDHVRSGLWVSYQETSFLILRFPYKRSGLTDEKKCFTLHIKYQTAAPAIKSHTTTTRTRKRRIKQRIIATSEHEKGGNETHRKRRKRAYGAKA